MAFNYPYGDTQQLNLNWFLAQWETFREQWATAEEGIDHALDAEIARVEAAMTDLYAARDAAAASKTAAQTAATNAASSETVATQQATLAQSYANTSQTQAGIATAAAEAAGNSASSASTSAAAANLSKTQAANSATAAQTAQTAAEAAETNIVSIITDAIQDAADAAAATATADAEAAADAAEASATAAAGSASDAADSATAAAGSATAAAGSATAAAGSATAAAGSATAAAGSASSAADSATAAAASAASIVVDSAMSDSSTNPVQNKVINGELTELKTALTELTPEVEAALEQKTISNVSVASFKDGAYNVPLRGLILNIKPKQAGGGEPSPTNIRTISGHTNAYVLRTQKNIFYANYAELVNAKGNNYVGYRYDWLTGQFTISAAANTTNDAIYAVVQKSNGTYDNDRLLASTSEHNTYTFSLNNGDILWIVDVSRTTESGIESAKTAFTQAKIQLEVGAEQTSYDGTAPSVLSMGGFGSAGTVYGATLNVIAGLLTVDTSCAVINSSSTIVDYWSAASNHRIGIQFADTIQPQYTDFWCSHYKVKTAYENNAIVKIHNSTSYVIQDDENITSLQSFKDYADAQQQNGTPITLCYKLATPTTYQLSEKQIKTLLGANTFRTTGGTIATLSYAITNNSSENIKLTKALIAPVLNSMVADTALVANDFRIFENTLYRITSPVASGATLTPNTNCVATTIAEILKSLLS